MMQMVPTALYKQLQYAEHKARHGLAFVRWVIASWSGQPQARQPHLATFKWTLQMAATATAATTTATQIFNSTFEA